MSQLHLIVQNTSKEVLLIRDLGSVCHSLSSEDCCFSSPTLDVEKITEEYEVHLAGFRKYWRSSSAAKKPWPEGLPCGRLWRSSGMKRRPTWVEISITQGAWVWTWFGRRSSRQAESTRSGASSCWWSCRSKYWWGSQWWKNSWAGCRRQGSTCIACRTDASHLNARRIDGFVLKLIETSLI